jgi:PEP-CTERM motif-containing protein
MRLAYVSHGGIRLMGSSFRAVGIAVGVLMAFMALPAKADSFHVTGATDAAGGCTMYPYPVGWCDDITFALDLTTEPPLDDSPDGGIHSVFLFLDMISGQINGVPVSCVRTTTPRATCGDLLAVHGNYSGPPIPDGNIGLLGSGGISAGLFGGTASIPLPYLGAVVVVIDHTKAVTTWNIVQTPEPSALLLISVGLIGFLAIGIRRFSR